MNKRDLVLIIGIASLGILSSCHSSSKKENEEKPVSAQTYYPTLQNDNEIFISGQVSAKQTAIVSTRVMGYIDRIDVKPGDKVNRGQLLIVINSNDLKAKKAQAVAMLTEATAAVKNARRDYERFKVLYSQKSVSSKELENIELNKTSMEAKQQMARQQLNEVNAMLAYTNIRAPFAGVVTQKMVDEGSTANPGMPILSIEQAGELNIQASVPETYIQYFHVGSKVNVDIKSLNKQMSGTVIEQSPSSSMTGGQYNIKIAIGDKKGLKAGMYAGIHIRIAQTTDAEPKIMINRASIIQRDQLTGVYVVDSDNTALLRWIRIGKVTGDQVEVLSGLNETERVIEKASGKLYNGVRIVPNK